MIHSNPRRLVIAGAISAPAVLRMRTRDAMQTYDRRTIDSLGAFLIGELERLDQKLHDPLVSVTWSRDIDLREDVSIADDVSSFTNSTFAAPGGVIPNGKNWISQDGNVISGISADIGKTANPMTLWGMELKYTIPELEKSQKLGRPIDETKFRGMNLKHQMDIDEQVYIGDTQLGQFGLFNADGYSGGMQVTNVTSVANSGTGSGTKWTTKTPELILADVNEMLTSVWAASGWAQIPTELRLPPAQYSYLVSNVLSVAGTSGGVSILKFLQENNLANQNGQKLNIQPVKWLIGAGAGGTPGVLGTVDRMVGYTKDMDRVRFPMVPLQRTPLEYRSLFQITTYFGRLGVVEIVYPETVGYRDGL